MSSVGSILLGALLWVGVGLAGAVADVPSSAPGDSWPDGALRARLTTIEAETISASLISIGGDGIVRYWADGCDREIALSDLHGIEPVGAGVSRGTAADRSVGRRMFYLADGGRVMGRLRSPPDGRADVLSVDIGLDRPVRMPLTALAAVRFSIAEDAAAERELQARLAARAVGRDVLIVVRGGGPSVLPGALEGLTPVGWTFRFGAKVRTASLERAYAVVLGAAPVSRGRLPVSVYLGLRGWFDVRIVKADASRLVIDAGSLGELAIPWRCVERVLLRSHRVVYVSDVEPAGVVRRSLFDVDWPVHVDQNVTGGPISLGGRVHEKGLGVHAFSAVSYSLDGEYERFSAMIGVDDLVAPHGNVVFRVKADGRELYSSGAVRGGERPRVISLDVRGVKTLTLECDYGEDLDLSDHGDWGSARLIRRRSHSKTSRGADFRPPNGKPSGGVFPPMSTALGTAGATVWGTDAATRSPVGRG